MSMYLVPSINLLGRGCLKELKDVLNRFGYQKAFIMTDPFLVKNGTVDRVVAILDECNIGHVTYSEVKPNPTVANVEHGLALLQQEKCDFIIGLGGGSAQDCGKAIAVLATNGGKAQDYEGINKSSKECLPIIAITSTAGTSAEVTINYVITDEDRHVKMVLVDRNAIAKVTVSDPELMLSKPAALTAATGMDALTHAIESVISAFSYPVTDATSLYSIKLIFENLATAVKDGNNIEARENMVYACFLNGIAFSNCGLGNVHAMAHQLGALYDFPHGVCNAMLLAEVEAENAKEVPHKFRPIAAAIGMHTEGKSDQECVDYVIRRIRELAKEVGIPEKLSELGVTDPDYDTMAEYAMVDPCAGANPKYFDKSLIIELFKKIA